MKCGAFSAKKCRLLAKACEGHVSVFSKRALDNLKLGKLPVQNMSWPRRPNVGLRQPAIQEQNVVRQVEVHRLSHFDDSEFEGFDED